MLSYSTVHFINIPAPQQMHFKNQNPIQFETWEIKSEHNSHGKGHENQQPLALFALCSVECLGEITWSIIQLI